MQHLPSDGPLFKPAICRMTRVIISSALLLSSVASAADIEAQAPAKRRMLILGDSLTAGYGVDPEESWPSQIQKLIDSEGLPVVVVNGGVSGDTSAGGLRRLNWQFRQPVDILFVELGGNDGLRGLPPESTYSNLVAIVEKTQERFPNVDVVIAGLQMPDNMGPDYVRQFREVFPRAAKATGSTLIPDLLEGVAGVPELNLEDFIHPNARGHRKVAEHVWPVLKEVLKGHKDEKKITSTQDDSTDRPANDNAVPKISHPL